MTKVNVLLLGGTGHTGERLAHALLKRGHEVCVLSRRPKSDSIVKRLIESGATIQLGSAYQAWTMMEVAQQCDILVSCSHIRYAKACLAVCETTGLKRYLQMSSTRGLTRFHHHPGVKEVREGEGAITESSLDYTIIRSMMIFGGKRDGNVERLVQWFNRHRWFPLFGKGDNLIQPVFVTDLVELMVRCIEDQEYSKKLVLSVGGPCSIEWREFLNEVAKACGVQNPIFLPIPLGIMEFVTRQIPKCLRPIPLDFLERQREDKIVSSQKEGLSIGQKSYQEMLLEKVQGINRR
jgi:nucleoside-diphosphate-sugar epimerase